MTISQIFEELIEELKVNNTYKERQRLCKQSCDKIRSNYSSLVTGTSCVKIFTDQVQMVVMTNDFDLTTEINNCKSMINDTGVTCSTMGGIVSPQATQAIITPQ